MSKSKLGLGIRKPGTDIGSWDGAFVYCENDEERVCGFFMDGKDYVGYPQTLDDAIWNYNNFRSFGWEPMTAADINQTAGVDIEHVYRVDDGERIAVRQTGKPFSGMLVAAGLVSIVIKIFVDRSNRKKKT